MRRIAVVTTFSRAGFAQYAKRMVRSWVKNWPADVHLHLYPDEEVRLKASDRVFLHYEEHPLKTRFMRRTAGKPRYQGMAGPKGYDYRFDVRKFAHKPFALWTFLLDHGDEYDALIWLDADTLTHSPVPFSVVDGLMAPAEVDLQFLGRPYKYTECGYLYFNLRGKGRDVLSAWVSFYAYGTFKAQQEWHDSFLFDVARRLVADVRESDLTGHLPKRKGGGHPMLNCFLGQYMDHLKGEVRKRTGRPRKGDLHVDHDAPYWTKENAHARSR